MAGFNHFVVVLVCLLPSLIFILMSTGAYYQDDLFWVQSEEEFWVTRLLWTFVAVMVAIQALGVVQESSPHKKLNKLRQVLFGFVVIGLVNFWILRRAFEFRYNSGEFFAICAGVSAANYVGVFLGIVVTVVKCRRIRLESMVGIYDTL